MKIKRTGLFGDYWGSPELNSEPLILFEQQLNATYIYSYLTDKGWSVQAIAGILGNMQAESSINPGRWQSEDIGNNSMGYGLVQWTPATKYRGWVSGDPSTMDNNLSRIIYEVENNMQWISVGRFSNMSFSDFSLSHESPGTLAIAFLLCYERPADQSLSVQNYRSSLANSWYEYLTGETPNPPTPIGSNHSRKKFNFILFKRRSRNGQR